MRPTKQDRSKSNPERLIAYCGLYCEDCPRFGGKMSRLAQALRRELESSGMARAARTRTARVGSYKAFAAFWEMLGMIAGFECPGCRKAGCSVTCRIRPCCIKRGLAGCWECAESVSCPEFRWLRAVHGQGMGHNLRALKRKGPSGFLRGKRYWLKTERQPKR